MARIMATPAAPHILPATEKETAVVVFLHHIGANGLGWSKKFETMRLPHVRYVFPNAPVRQFSVYDGTPVTAWFDVHGFSNISPVDEKGLAESTTKLHQLLDSEIGRGVPSERIFLGGYSLGGCLALHGCATYDKPLAGAVGLNCWLADYRPDCFSRMSPANKNTQTLHLHGDTDPLISLKYAKMSAEACKTWWPNFNFKVYKCTSHWPTQEMFEQLKTFISERVPALEDASNNSSSS